MKISQFWNFVMRKSLYSIGEWIVSFTNFILADKELLSYLTWEADTPIKEYSFIRLRFVLGGSSTLGLLLHQNNALTAGFVLRKVRTLHEQLAWFRWRTFFRNNRVMTYIWISFFFSLVSVSVFCLQPRVLRLHPGVKIAQKGTLENLVHCYHLILS